MHTPCKNKQNKRVFLVVAENIVGSLCVLLGESFVLRHLVFAPIRNTKKLPNEQKEIATKTRSPVKTKASLADIFAFFTSIRSPVPGYQVENASPKTVNKALWQPFQPGLPRNLKVANRKPQKTARFWKRLKISFQSCELSMKWTLVSCMSYLWLPVTSTDLIISIENKDLSSNISLSTFLKILFRFNYNHFVIKFLWAVTYIWSPVFTSLPSSNK